MQQTTHPMKQLFNYLKTYQYQFTYACSSSIANRILDLMPPLLVAWVIDSVRGEPPSWIAWTVGTSDPWTLAIFLAILGVAIFGFESLFQWMYQKSFMILAQQVQHDLRLDAYHQLQHREIAFFENHRMGETMAVLNDDVNQLERFLNAGFNDLLQLGILLIFSVIVLFSTSWQLALIGMAPFPIIIWGSFYYQRKISPRYDKVRQAVGGLSSRLENNIGGIQVIKSFTAEDFELERVRLASQNYMDVNLKAIQLSAAYIPIIRMAIAFGFGGVLLLGSYWILNGYDFLSVGELVLFSMLIQRLLWPLTRLGQTLDEFERSRASATRIFNLLNTPSLIQDPNHPKDLPNRDLGKLEFQNVQFSYQHKLPILKGLDFTIKPGEMIGVAGVTGAGKSTLIKLLLRFYDVTNGAILLNDIDIRQIPLKTLRQQMALVSQDVYLFHGTIRENIAYGMSDKSIESIIKASKQAQLHDFVKTLPEGYDSIVGERGIKLSGGQRQRLSLARAILKDAPILILDEATSSVDTETERAIQKNLTSLTQGKTSLIIAHRLSTIRQADRILVLRDGQLEQEGPHTVLLKQGGTYADLWAIQIGEAHE